MSDPTRFTDAERFRVLTRLITDRLTALDTLRAAGRFTPADAREHEVLKDLLQRWVLEQGQE